MFLSGGVISCQLEHPHRILLCNSYNTDLYLAWNVEIWERIKRVSETQTFLLDVSRHSSDKQILPRAYLKRILLHRHKLDTLVARDFLPDYFAEEHSLFRNVFKDWISCAFRLLSILPKIFRCKNLDSFFRISNIEEAALRSAHSTLSGKLGTVEYMPRRYTLVLFTYLVSFKAIQIQVRKALTDGNFCQIVVGNGRLLNSAAALSDLPDGVSRLIVERGSRPGKLDTYRTSAHSMSERRLHLELAWNSTDFEFAENTAIQYLETRKIQDPISGIKWNSKQRSGLLPEIRNEKKICVFYTTTELEFAVFFDPVDKSEFQTQSDALLALTSLLDPNTWDIFVRRHPYSKKLKHDPEGKNWSKFEALPNVYFIRPESEIDSYALGARADLVAHYNSSIGPELIFQSNCPVITLGDNSWESLDSDYLCRTKDKLATFLSINLPTRPKSDAYRWAYYSAIFGENFNIVEWRNFKAFISSKHLLSRRKFEGESN